MHQRTEAHRIEFERRATGILQLEPTIALQEEQRRRLQPVAEAGHAHGGDLRCPGRHGPRAESPVARRRRRPARGRRPHRPLIDEPQHAPRQCIAAQPQEEPRGLHRLAVGVHRARHQPQRVLAPQQSMEDPRIARLPAKCARHAQALARGIREPRIDHHPLRDGSLVHAGHHQVRSIIDAGLEPAHQLHAVVASLRGQRLPGHRLADEPQACGRAEVAAERVRHGLELLDRRDRGAAGLAIGLADRPDQHVEERAQCAAHVGGALRREQLAQQRVDLPSHVVDSANGRMRPRIRNRSCAGFCAEIRHLLQGCANAALLEVPLDVRMPHQRAQFVATIGCKPLRGGREQHAERAIGRTPAGKRRHGHAPRGKPHRHLRGDGRIGHRHGDLCGASWRGDRRDRVHHRGCLVGGTAGKHDGVVRNLDRHARPRAVLRASIAVKRRRQFVTDGRHRHRHGHSRAPKFVKQLPLQRLRIGKQHEHAAQRTDAQGTGHHGIARLRSRIDHTRLAQQRLACGIDGHQGIPARRIGIRHGFRDMRTYLGEPEARACTVAMQRRQARGHRLHRALLGPRTRFRLGEERRHHPRIASPQRHLPRRTRAERAERPAPRHREASHQSAGRRQLRRDRRDPALIRKREQLPLEAPPGARCRHQHERIGKVCDAALDRRRIEHQLRKRAHERGTIRKTFDEPWHDGENHPTAG